MQRRWVGAVAMAVWLTAAVTIAQPPQGGDGRHGNHPPPGQPNQPETMSAEEAEQRQRRADFFLQELDANHNGVIEAEEVAGRKKYYADRLLQRAGLEPNYPVAMSRVREGMQRYYQSVTVPGTPGAPGTSPAGLPGTPPPGSPSGPATPPPQPLVPGFGVVAMTTTAPPAVRGFGGPGPQPAGAATQPAGAATQPAAGIGPSSLPPPKNDEEARVRHYAKSLLQQYDANKNGTLERDEWSQMKQDVKAADTNGDGIITLDELTVWLTKFSHNRPPPGGPGGPGGSGSPSASSVSAKRPPYRLSTPTERLPSGMPDWFLQKDADGDGQVSMAEFASDWSEAKVADFKHYDSNEDGMITALECLAVDKGKEKEKEKDRKR